MFEILHQIHNTVDGTCLIMVISLSVSLSLSLSLSVVVERLSYIGMLLWNVAETYYNK